MKEGSPESYWLRVSPTPQTVLSAESHTDCRVCLRTHYAAYTARSMHQTVQRAWSQPFWLTKTTAKRISIVVNDNHQSLYVYVYTLHNTHFLEIYDRIPALLLSPLQSRALRLKHYNRYEYRNPFYYGTTETDTASDGTASSKSSVDMSYMGPLSLYTTHSQPSESSQRTGAAPHSHHFFDIQTLDDSPVGSQQVYEGAYSNPHNVQVVVSVPSVSVSLYDVVSGCYHEMTHVVVKGIRCVLQQGGCELFSGFVCFHSLADEVVKTLPLLRIAALLSLSLEVQNVHVDTYLDPAQPLLQLPFEAKERTESLRVSLVIDRMKDSRLTKSLSLSLLTSSAVLLCDVQVPYFFLNVTDHHLLTLLRSVQSYVSLASLFAHPPQPSSLSLEPVTHSQSPSLYHIAYCRIHPIYFLLSLESNTFISVGFQRVPLRVRLQPFIRFTASIDDYIRHTANALVPSFLLQSPIFVGALDLLGNPGTIVVSLYHSLLAIVRNPLQAARNGDGLLTVLKSFTASSLSLLQTVVGSLLGGISSISANLSRNIRRLNDDDGTSFPFLRP